MEGARRARGRYRPHLVVVMGFQPPQKVYNLHFEGDEYDGLEVKARSAPIGQLLSLMSLANVDVTNIAPEQLQEVTDLFDMFSDKLTEWNVEYNDGPHKGEPVPATREGVRGQDGDFVVMIILEWINAIIGVSGPLPTGLSNGGKSPVPSLPMATELPNQPN